MKQLNQQMLQRAVSQQQTPTEKNLDLDNTPIKYDGMEMNIAEWIQLMFLEAFSHKWKHEELPSVWKLKIGRMSQEQIKRAVWASCDNAWPPSLGEFIEAGKGASIDYEVSFNRFMTLPKAKLTDVEYFAATDVEGNKCRTTYDERRARKVWEGLIDKYEARRQAGELPDRNQKAINANVKTKSDWQGPDGNFYSCPAEYWASINNK